MGLSSRLMSEAAEPQHVWPQSFRNTGKTCRTVDGKRGCSGEVEAFPFWREFPLCFCVTLYSETYVLGGGGEEAWGNSRSLVDVFPIFFRLRDCGGRWKKAVFKFRGAITSLGTEVAELHVLLQCCCAFDLWDVRGKNSQLPFPQIHPTVCGSQGCLVVLSAGGSSSSSWETSAAPFSNADQGS